jgi:hypothetical protein
MAINRHKLLPITWETTEINAQKWLHIIRYRESGIVVQPQDDCEYRVPQVIGNSLLLKKYLGPYHRKFLLCYVSLDSNYSWEKSIIQTLEKMIKNRRIFVSGNAQYDDLGSLLDFLGNRGYDVGLFLGRATHFLDRNDAEFFLKLEYFLQQTRNLSVVLFLEKDIARIKYRYFIDKCSLLFKHLLYYPFYKEADIRQFLRFYAKLWGYNLKKNKEDEIVRLCGGYLWLADCANMYFRDNPDANIAEVKSDSLMLQKISVVWSKFTPEEQKIIKDIVSGGFKPLQIRSEELTYLEKIGLLYPDGSGFKLGIPILKEYFNYENSLKDLYVQVNRIYKGGDDITDEFLLREKKLMVLFLTGKKKIVSRDCVSEALWGPGWEEKYSDWAIDKIISRLRIKLTRLGIDQKLLKTVKRKGFLWG